ncbi:MULTISPECIES: hypothetical protein [unclassified Streptomyces]|uniref:hypothetical protein n=1 Tax=unclassified Streptomyces TaxID=2593676 RepID=UPI002E2A001F|nr:hypothetical protein [Streptomyces sp. NBC_01429]
MTLNTLSTTQQLALDQADLPMAEGPERPAGDRWGLVPASVPREFAAPTPELLCRVARGLRGWAA